MQSTEYFFIFKHGEKRRKNERAKPRTLSHTDLADLMEFCMVDCMVICMVFGSRRWHFLTKMDDNPNKLNCSLYIGISFDYVIVISMGRADIIEEQFFDFFGDFRADKLWNEEE